MGCLVLAAPKTTGLPVGLPAPEDSGDLPGQPSGEFGTPATRSNREQLGWLFMRASGLLLVVLIAGHLITNVLQGAGVRQVNFAFVAGKWASPFWQTWSLLLLWLGLFHGTNGIRGILRDYVRRDAVRFVLSGVLYLVVLVILALGTLVIFTLDPCPAGAPAHLLPSFCAS